MDIKKELGNKIKRVRQIKGITQEQLAEMTGISIRTLGGIEIGENFMTSQTMEKIITALGISINDLFTAEHLKPTNDLISEISFILNDLKNNRSKIEEIYKVIKAIVTV